MKKQIIFLLFIITSISNINAQVLFEEHFDSWDFPPTGWSVVDFDYEHWHSGNSTNAGGTGMEATLDWYPYTDVGMTRLISPEIDFTGKSVITLSFKQKVLHDYESFEVGVATRSNEGDWNVVWSKNVTETILPEERVINISNSDVNSTTFQFCLYFDGDFYNFGGWYIDDIEISEPATTDASVLAILGERQFSAADAYIPTANIQNVGLNTENIKMSCTISDFETGNQAYTDTVTVSIDAGEVEEVEFANFNIPENSKVYEVKVKTHLAGDINSDNDELNKFINTYTLERQMVLVEIGTGTWCTNCSSAAAGADSLVNAGHDAAIIEHHKSDDFEIPDALIRIDYYGINGYPSAFFDGRTEKGGGCPSLNCYDEYLPIYNNCKTIKAPITISITSVETFTAGVYTIHVEIDKNEPVPEVNLKLQVALTESHIYHPWGISPPLDYLDYVNRGFFPDANGTTIDLLNNSNISHEFTINAADYDIEHCEIVAFVESPSDRYLYQTSKIKLNDLPTSVLSSESEQVLVYPNPINDLFYVSINQKDDENTVYLISNVYGKIIKRGTLFTGINNIDVSKLTTGNYYLRISKGEKTYVKKITIIK